MLVNYLHCLLQYITLRPTKHNIMPHVEHMMSMASVTAFINTYSEQSQGI